jgi:hypothetical protein
MTVLTNRQPEDTCSLGLLPEDLYPGVLFHLTTKDLYNLQQTCKRISSIVNSYDSLSPFIEEYRMSSSAIEVKRVRVYREIQCETLKDGILYLSFFGFVLSILTSTCVVSVRSESILLGLLAGVVTFAGLVVFGWSMFVCAKNFNCWDDRLAINIDDLNVEIANMQDALDLIGKIKPSEEIVIQIDEPRSEESYLLL